VPPIVMMTAKSANEKATTLPTFFNLALPLSVFSETAS
jgi:hypothetical protein